MCVVGTTYCGAKFSGRGESLFCQAEGGSTVKSDISRCICEFATEGVSPGKLSRGGRNARWNSPSPLILQVVDRNCLVEGVAANSNISAKRTRMPKTDALQKIYLAFCQKSVHFKNNIGIFLTLFGFTRVETVEHGHTGDRSNYALNYVEMKGLRSLGIRFGLASNKNFNPTGQILSVNAPTVRPISCRNHNEVASASPQPTRAQCAKLMSKFAYVLPVLCLLLIGLCGCMTPQASSSLSQGANLNAFNCVSIAPLLYNGVEADTYGVTARVRDQFSRLGFQVLSPSELKQQQLTNALRTLYCVMQHGHTPDNMGGSYATVTINLYDIARTLVYTGNGRFQGLSIEGDLKGATDQALKGFTARYSGFDPAAKPSALVSVEARISAQNQSVPKFGTKEELLKFYDSHMSTLDRIEGIWTSRENDYQIGIYRRDEKTNEAFVAVIIRADNPFWRPGQIKMLLDSTAQKSIYSGIYYVGDHSKQGATGVIDPSGFLNIEFKDNDGSNVRIVLVKNYPPNSSTDQTSQTPPDSSGPKTTGSGFIFTKGGLVAGNYHVVEGASKIWVILPGSGKRFKAGVLIKDEQNDLAILKLTDFTYSEFFKSDIPFSLGETKNARVGEDIFTIGYPLGSLLGKSPKLSSGIISSLFGIKDDPRVYQISAPIQPGSSGSPLFNRKGELVGVVVATLNSKFFFDRTQVIPQNVNFAIKSCYLANLAAMLPESPQIMSITNDLSGKSLESQVEAIAPFVVTLEVD